MPAPSSSRASVGCSDGLNDLRIPQNQVPHVATCGGIAEGVKSLLESSCVAIEVPKRPQAYSPSLNACVSDSPEFSIRYTGEDSVSLRNVFDRELRHCGFSFPVRDSLGHRIAGMFEDLRDAAPRSSYEAVLILRRPRSRAHWHIDHYRPGALQFVSTLAGYPTTPFLLRGDYDQPEFERYRSLISLREVECQGLSPSDSMLHPLKAGMNQLAYGVTPRFVRGDLLFKGDELLHATPQSTVSRLVFAMSAVSLGLK